jgi:predicted MPP superfamily phosphohydrolase
MKHMGIIFIVFALAILAGAVYYLSNRYALFFSSIPKKAWIWGFVASLVIVILCINVFSNTANPIGKAIYIFGGIALSLLLFMLLSVALTDLFNLIFKFTPQIRGFISIGLAVLLTAYGLWNAHNIKEKEITIPVKGLTHEIRAVLITDIHLGNFWGKRQADKIVRKIKDISPDVVFNTGDMFYYGKKSFDKNQNVLSAFLTLDIPHYFVYGNHDEQIGVQKVIKRMENVNATVLLNEIAYFGELQIIGLENMLQDENASSPHAKPGAETIKSIMTKLPIDENRPTIVLHHRPAGVEYMQEKGADLLLAGHTHAGQMFPSTSIHRLMYKYNKGLYKYKTLNIYVSQGVGTIFSPVRLGTNSEITVIRLVPEKPSL